MCRVPILSGHPEFGGFRLFFLALMRGSAGDWPEMGQKGPKHYKKQASLPLFGVRNHPRVPIQGGRVPILSGHPVYMATPSKTGCFLAQNFKNIQKNSFCFFFFKKTGVTKTPLFCHPPFFWSISKAVPERERERERNLASEKLCLRERERETKKELGFLKAERETERGTWFLKGCAWERERKGRERERERERVPG